MKLIKLLSIAVLCFALPIESFAKQRPTTPIYLTICAPGVNVLVGTPCPPAAQDDSATKIAFVDLINGPNTGMGDGNGDGVIVTVWGNNLDDISTGRQGATGKRVVFIDSTLTERAPYVYYSQNADGTTPGGPANLYESHGFDEIAISIPSTAATGQGLIKIIEADDTESNGIEFTVRAGSILHIKSTGNDSTGTGTFSAPYRTVDAAMDNASDGATFYIHDVDTGSGSTYRAIYVNNNAYNITGSQTAQLGFVAYPGFQPKLIGQQGFQGYLNDGLIASKLDVYSSNYTTTTTPGDQPSGSQINSGGTWGIKGSAFGRIIGNKIGDLTAAQTGSSRDGCATKVQGAIYANAQFRDYTSGLKTLGNEIYNYGCSGTDRLHHTTYFSIRSDGEDLQVEPIEIGYMYLHGNRAKNGLHIYDQDTGCGDYTGTVRIHNNVVVNQGGAGIAVGVSGCSWTNDFVIENNILIDVGLPTDWDNVTSTSGTQIDGNALTLWDSGLNSTVYIRNNTIIGWKRMELTFGGEGCFGVMGSGDGVVGVINNNICVDDSDRPFVYHSESATSNNFSGANNIWYSEVETPSNSAPSWDASAVTTDPLLTITGPLNGSVDTDGDQGDGDFGPSYTIGGGSPAIDGSPTLTPLDIYNVIRSTPNSNMGAVE